MTFFGLVHKVGRFVQASQGLQLIDGWVVLGGSEVFVNQSTKTHNFIIERFLTQFVVISLYRMLLCF